ncbi:hypothetical protein OZX56_00445 [Lactobacillus sp. ESL0684]|uniref:hypothetical protein n=1 Tax=unclassified Lactobacillus TaxID=2620435 RepID=UPI0023F81290|nr:MULTISPECIES: hypothetical protein [unclassified Lactobacillus]WEV39727.1 hypothetical protein OZX59_05775 [Lactobacillus sp. ESL0681]WEV43739.1 hypothetical protein OZX56_00445 [Lactobacillus sp. ESL0684]
MVDKYSDFDYVGLANNLADDISNCGNFVVWAYWYTTYDKQEVFFEYFYLDNLEAAITNPKYRSVAEVDQLVIAELPLFFRKKMEAVDLLQIFVKENREWGQKQSRD